MKSHHIYSLLPIVLIALLLSGCYSRGVLVIPAETHSHSTHTTTVITRYVPPPHAPAHGYRHHHHDHDLRFDTAFGAYVVINMPGLYFYDDHYLRYYDDRWQVTTRLNERWRPARENDIPRKLKMAKQRDKKNRYAEEHRHEHREEHRRDHHDGPEHGHHRRHQDHDLNFDARIGAYVVLQQPGIYFHNNHYLRQHRGVWQTSKAINGRWRTAKNNEIPDRLMKAKPARKKKHSQEEKSKGRYKEKWQ